MARDKNKQDGFNQGTMNTIVGKGSTIDGTFNIESSIRIDGILRGELESSGTLVLGPSGQIEANVKVQNAVIGGRVVGNLEVANRIRLESKSIVMGNIKTKLLVVEEGAVFKGNCDSGEDVKISQRENEKDVLTRRLKRESAPASDIPSFKLKEENTKK